MPTDAIVLADIPAIDGLSFRPVRGVEDADGVYALITRALRDLYERGHTVVRLHTTLEFPTHAMDLYKSVGFRVVKEFPRYRKTPA